MIMCRLAHDAGNGQILWPEGVTSIEQVPRDLMRAVNHAFKIISWYENLIEDEIPPEWMWPFDEELSGWFEEVKRNRESKYGGSSSSRDDEEVPMMENELVRDRK